MEKKQYKLIKIYPTSPELGTIVTVKNNSIEYKGKIGYNQTYKIKESTIINTYKEFWEEIIEPKYSKANMIDFATEFGAEVLIAITTKKTTPLQILKAFDNWTKDNNK